MFGISIIQMQVRRNTSNLYVKPNNVIGKSYAFIIVERERERERAIIKGRLKSLLLASATVSVYDFLIRANSTSER